MARMCLTVGLIVAIFVNLVHCKDPYFWHVTDFHLDPTYRTSGDTCNELLTSEEKGEFGNYRCDAPYQLVKDSVKAMIKKGRKPEFILYTGDTPGHPKDYTKFNRQYIYELHVNITNLFNELLPDAKFVVALGNHDYYPKDQLPGRTNRQYEDLAELWSPWFDNDPTIIETFKKGAYYTQMISRKYKLRVVVTNTNLYLTSNKQTITDSDPAGQYAWLEQTLANARANGDNVHLIVHVPFGTFEVEGCPRWIRERDNVRFNNIVREYADVIKGYYSCHEHLDSFRMYYDKKGKPKAVMLIAPSVSPWIARIGPSPQDRGPPHNPGLRQVFFDEEEGYLSNIIQYYLNLETANKKGKARWKKLYSFTDLYGTRDVTPKSIHKLVQSFKKPGRGDSLFRIWFKMMVVRAKDKTGVLSEEKLASRENCDCECKARSICSMEKIEYGDFDVCKAEGAAKCAP